MKPEELKVEYNLTDEDLEIMEKGFRIHSGGGSYVNRDQWMKMWCEGQETLDPEYKELGLITYKAFDVDGNNKLDLDEWRLLQSVTLHGNKEQTLKFAFVIADESRDGQISRKELIRVLERNVYIIKRAVLRKAFTKDGVLDKFMYNTSSRRVTLTPDDKKKIKELADALIGVAELLWFSSLASILYVASQITLSFF